jgi:hypothetical protein
MSTDEKERLDSLPYGGPALVALTIHWASYVLQLPRETIETFVTPECIVDGGQVAIPFSIIEEISRRKAAWLNEHTGCKKRGCPCRSVRRSDRNRKPPIPSAPQIIRTIIR